MPYPEAGSPKKVLAHETGLVISFLAVNLPKSREPYAIVAVPAKLHVPFSVAHEAEGIPKNILSADPTPKLWQAFVTSILLS